jgi:hypothetical protein
MQSVIILLATAAFIAAPFVTPPFMGYDPGLFPVSITRPSIQPAGYAFSIWGVIYLWLLVSAAFGLIRRSDTLWARPFVPHLAALLLGTVWLAIAASWPLTATVTIIAMAGFTLWAFLAADPAQNRWLQHAPLGLFAGWLTAASCVSFGVILAGYGWLSDTGAAVAMLAAILLIALTVQTRRPTMPTYSVAVVWAAIGVAAVNWTANPTVAYAALAGAAIQFAAALRAFTR